ncbi:MAG: DUF3048 domain-containing protein [Actinobacteria bacterium]|nr:DUF3048 domain-containing protein [Actinomycetota bacterium]
MNLTHRGKIVLTAAAVIGLSGAGVGALALTGNAPAPIQTAFDTVTGTSHSPAPPPTCPLTGEPAPGGKVPKRPALAIKVENLPEARPQTGLDHADIVYEEPVEGGITRFIAVFQCRDGGKVGPVRSGRVEDPDILRQLGRPVFGFAGGAAYVQRAVTRSPLIDENYIVAANRYTRDPSRVAPHNLYTTTKGLWAEAKGAIAKAHSSAPEPIFVYSGTIPSPSRKAGRVHLPFSSYSDVYWAWSAKEGIWLRSHGDVPHMLTDGRQVAATNVVVMSVRLKESSRLDPAGNPVPMISVTGSGKAWILRDGRVIAGRWQRPSVKDLTTFVTRSGEPIALAPGTTWVELLPSTIKPEVSKG